MTTPAPPTTGFELEIALSLAAVPAWAPVGADPHRYRELLQGSAGSAPSPEVLQFHQERWGHVEHYDDFVELLDLSGFDAEDLLALAVAAGADRIVVTARSADGWCWWDTPRPERNVAALHARRNPLGELAAAASDRGMPLGVHYCSPGPDVASTEDLGRTVRDDLRDLFDRYAVTALSGSWPGAIDEVVGLAVGGASRPVEVDVDGRSELDLPRGWSHLVERHSAEARPGAGWVCRIPSGSGFGWSRADRPQRQLDVERLLSRYLDVVGSGGRLRLALPITDEGGPDPDGARVAAEAGTWIRRFGPTVRGARPARLGGTDDGLCYLRTGDDPDDDLLVIVTGERRQLHRLTTDTVRLERVVELDGVGAAEHPVQFTQDERGVQLGARSDPSSTEEGSSTLRAYRLTVASGDGQIGLFAPSGASEIALAPLLADTQPGEIVNLGAGPYLGPAVVPAGVTLRGLGAQRTRIVKGVTDDGGTSAAVVLSERARLEHVTIDTVLVAPRASDATLLGCAASSVHVCGDRATLRASSIGHVTVEACDAATISRCRFEPPPTGPAAIAVVGGDGHLVEGCSIEGGDTGVLVRDANGTTVRGCTLRAAGTAIHLAHTTGSHVAANLIDRATRAVEVEGGDDILVDGNAVSDADSGALVHCGAAECEVSGNYWELCRIGLLVWQAPDVRWRDNISTDLGSPDEQVRSGP